MMTRLFSLLLTIGILSAVVDAATLARTRSRKTTTAARKKKARPSAWKRATYVDPTKGDNVDGEDLAVRRAAVAALGDYNGSVVVVDPSTGRILTIVNQRLAYKSGFVPCSTIKLVTAFAALSEHVVERDTHLRLTRYVSLDLTNALAHSNNIYFAKLGQKLGFE